MKKFNEMTPAQKELIYEETRRVLTITSTQTIRLMLQAAEVTQCAMLIKKRAEAGAGRRATSEACQILATKNAEFLADVSEVFADLMASVAMDTSQAKGTVNEIFERGQRFEQ